MPSDCAGACACDCRSPHPKIRSIEIELERLEKEVQLLTEENRRLKAKLAKVSADRHKVVDELAKKLKDL